MNYGNFFRLNNNKSDIGNGIAVFDYLWLHDAEHMDGSPKYPVYLTITKESIDFHVHYFNEQNTDGTKKIKKHLHNTILSLPLSDNIDVKDGLTGALVEGYETNFPTKEEGESNYLFKLLASTIENHDSEKENGYSALKEFNANIEELKKILNDIPSSRFIQKLILDFIFDLEHTRVFQSSPYYENISIKLKANYFFNALAAKANFYYQAKNLSEFKPTPEQTWSIDTEYYLKSELEWTKQIRNTKSEENFNGHQDEWFEDPINEMKAVYYVRKKLNIDDQLKIAKTGEKKNKLIEQYKANRKLSDKWRIAHYDIWTSRCRIFPRCSGFLCICFPRLFISIIAAWLTFILGSGLWGNIGDGGFQRIINQPCIQCCFYIALFLGCFIWIRNSGLKHKIAPSCKIKCLYTTSSIWITGISLIYSSIIGFVLTIFIYEKEDGKGFDFHFPFRNMDSIDIDLSIDSVSYLGVGIFLSMFIGLVIQSFMDNKPPTEPL
jgi:hypothetical protein